MIRIESAGSIWEIDEDLRRYRRFPKVEAPRERPEWSDERAGSLQDAIWHEYEGEWWLADNDRFWLQVEKREGDSWWYVSAPEARVLGRT